MENAMDWRKIFTDAFRTKRFQDVLNKSFKNKDKIEITRDELEYLIINTCSDVIEAGIEMARGVVEDEA